MDELTHFVKKISDRVSSLERRHDLEDELRYHLEATTQELVDHGLPLREARTQAMQRFGDPHLIAKELGRVHNQIKFRYFAAGGLIWYLVGAILFETGAFNISHHWLAQLPFQVLGLPHWFAMQAPQIRDLPLWAPVARLVSQSLRISLWHLDAITAALILTPAAYGAYRLLRAALAPEGSQAWALLGKALKN